MSTEKKFMEYGIQTVQKQNPWKIENVMYINCYTCVNLIINKCWKTKFSSDNQWAHLQTMISWGTIHQIGYISLVGLLNRVHRGVSNYIQKSFIWFKWRYKNPLKVIHATISKDYVSDAPLHTSEQCLLIS